MTRMMHFTTVYPRTHEQPCFHKAPFPLVKTPTNIWLLSVMGMKQPSFTLGSNDSVEDTGFHQLWLWSAGMETGILFNLSVAVTAPYPSKKPIVLYISKKCFSLCRANVILARQRGESASFMTPTWLTGRGGGLTDRQTPLLAKWEDSIVFL